MISYRFIFLIFMLQRINPFLIISMKVNQVDGCIRKIEIDNETTLYERDNITCYYFQGNNLDYNIPIFPPIPYEIGQKIKILIGDIAGNCFFDMDIIINNKTIKNDNIELWSCGDCENNNLNIENNILKCYESGKNVEPKNFSFYFQINSLKQLGFPTSEYFYVLNNTNYFFISPDDFNNTVNLIDLSSKVNLYAKNKDGKIISPFYDYIYYKLFFDIFSIYEGEFYGSDESNNVLILNEETYSRIFQNKNLRYNLSDEEKMNKGVHLKLKIGIFNNQKKRISELQDYNFYICLKGYKFCDLKTSLKCLKEGYYQIDDRYYSCYETCKNCDTYKNPESADYFKNYCDECKEEYPYFINIIEDESGKEYKSCYKECPIHAPEIKDYGRNECVSYCPRYKTNYGKCIDSCDYNFYKYLLKNERKCYNNIPKKFFIYIDNYTDFYNNTDKPIIKLGEKCPSNSYDSSYDNFCINLEEDIFNFVVNPKELIVYHNPLIKRLDTKEMVIRAYSSDKKLDKIDNNKDKLIQIDNSKCEKKIKESCEIDDKESLIIHDVYNLEENKYFFRVFTKEGKELNYTICEKEDIIIKEFYYKIDKPINLTKCPKDFPYLQIYTNKCLKNCDILSFLNKSCITDNLFEDIQINNINIIKKSIEDHSIDYLLDNITKGGSDITVEEENIKYQISSTWNQNINNNENISNVRIGKCENILKEKYNITSETPLLIFKLDIDMEGYSAPAVEYEIYNPITKEKLNLKYCNNEQINVAIPVSIDENELFKYNPKSEFYNDICSTYSTNFKTDMTLNDRQKEFLNKNMTLCESDCSYSSYDNTLKKVECKCDVKYNIKDLYEIKIDKDKLKASLNLKNLINIQVLKCYKKLFTKDGLFLNIGSYILLSIIFLYIISMIYLILKDYSFLKNEIIKLFYFSLATNDKEYGNNSYITKSSNELIISRAIGKDFSKPPPIFNENYNKDIKVERDDKFLEKAKKKSIYQINKLVTQNNDLKNTKTLIPEYAFLTELLLNDSTYLKALLYDKRTIWQYFFSLLKSEHLLLFAIIPSKDYNSRAIKICIFLFTFALFFADNAIFMNEDAIHNIYENQGTLDLIYQIPQIIYSNIISFVIDKIIRFLSLSLADVIEEKRRLRRERKRKISDKFFKFLFIKYIFFFIISFSFLILFWFYISCFCFVYRNTQIYLIKDTLSSFGLSLVTPFIIYLLSAALRIFSLKKQNRNFFYIISKLVLF